MKRKKHPGLWLVCTAFLVMFCRCSTTLAPDQTSADGRTFLRCEKYITSSIPSVTGVVCSIKVTCTNGTPSGVKDIWSVDGVVDFSDLTMAQINEQGCANNDSDGVTLHPVDQTAALSSENKSAPTEPPTEEPAPPTEPPAESAPLKPFLTGAFTACDNVARYVNFTIAEGAPAYDPATFQMLFNGQAVTCTPAASNSKTLTCIYPPAPYGPPASIEVYIGAERVNEFTFDGGSVCDPAPQPNNNTGNTGEGEQAPAATEPPSD